MALATFVTAVVHVYWALSHVDLPTFYVAWGYGTAGLLLYISAQLERL